MCFYLVCIVSQGLPQNRSSSLGIVLSLASRQKQYLFLSLCPSALFLYCSVTWRFGPLGSPYPTQMDLPLDNDKWRVRPSWFQHLLLLWEPALNKLLTTLTSLPHTQEINWTRMLCSKLIHPDVHFWSFPAGDVVWPAGQNMLPSGAGGTDISLFLLDCWSGQGWTLFLQARWRTQADK